MAPAILNSMKRSYEQSGLLKRLPIDGQVPRLFTASFDILHSFEMADNVQIVFSHFTTLHGIPPTEARQHFGLENDDIC